MPGTEQILESISPLGRTRVPAFTAEYMERWCASCTEFLQWEREYILKGDPSREKQDSHRETLKWMLRLTRLIQSVAADPDFPEHSLLELVEMKLWQLDQSWKMIYEPMPAREADKILAQIFPNES